eukprot:4328056-Pyramimonas_sp.AAC.1
MPPASGVAASMPTSREQAGGAEGSRHTAGGNRSDDAGRPGPLKSHSEIVLASADPLASAQSLSARSTLRQLRPLPDP